MSAINDKPLSIEGTVQLTGFANGLRYPSLIARVKVAIPPPQQAGLFSSLSGQLRSLFQSMELEPGEMEQSVDGSAGSFLTLWMYHISQAANVPVYERGVLVGSTDKHCLVALPFFGTAFDATNRALNWLFDTLNDILTGKGYESSKEEFSTVLEQLKQSGPGNFNTPRFLRAAFDAGIPTTSVAGHIIQYGQGVRARWLDSSFTDKSPCISASLAWNKDHTSKVLRHAGLPVAANALCGSAEDAVKLANRLGYPVVVKPADKDGGKAVAAGLTTEAEVRSAFSIVLNHTKKVLVEKHIHGRDYRLNVFNNELLWAIERIPAGVTGDGQSTIRKLIERENTDPRRSESKQSSLKKLVLDKSALSVLENRGQKPEDVPREGEFVPLRRNANISTGGTPVAVMDKVHPDNRRLAIRAAKALRLDLAGIDFICRDISRSWKESDAAICEVNGQPQLGGVTCPHVYGQILESLIEGNGRVPIAVVLGAHPDAGMADSLYASLQESGVNAGLADRSGVTVENERIVDGDVGFYSAGQILIRDRSVQAIVINLDSCRVIETGLPFDRFDILVIAGRHIYLPRNSPPQQQQRALEDLFKMVLSACVGKVIVPKEVEENLGTVSQWTSAEWVSTSSKQAQLIELASEELISTI